MSTKNIFILLILIIFQSGYSQVRFKDPKVDIMLKTGYDNNILRVSESADSNRVSGASQDLELDAVQWIYWGRGAKTYVSFSGNYNWFSSSYPENAGSGYLKIKTFVDILGAKAKDWTPEIRWDFEIRGAILDRYYSNRSLGEEFSTIIDRLSGRTLPLGDLFDRKYARFATGLRFVFSQPVMAEVEYFRQLNNYTDITDPTNGEIYSLDNSEHDVLTSISVVPKDWMTIRMGYNWSSRSYDHKFATDIGGNTVPDLNRKYNYHEYELQFIAAFENIEGHIRYLYRVRGDNLDGYYGYKAQKISIGASYQFIPDWMVLLEYDSSHKLYDHITLGGELLDNGYFDFVGRINYQVSPSFNMAAVYAFESENSSYDKFTYKRHISFIEFQYNIY